jgi:hydroxyacylglutathione hydrolase
MQIRTFALGSFEVNAYLLISDNGRDGIIIDAPEESEQVIDACADAGVEPSWLLLTHGHADHLAGAEALRQRWPRIKIGVHAGDEPKLHSPMANLSMLMGMSIKAPAADQLLKEGDEIAVAEIRLKVLETPGHTPGGICLLADDSTPPALFTGDTLFALSVGRTDFPGGNSRQLVKSIREKLFVLPQETICYPGHGPATTIANERAMNPFAAEE